MIPVKFPKWHEDARKLRASGMSTAQVVMALKDAGIEVSETRVSFVTSPNWELLTGRENARGIAKSKELTAAKREGRLPDVKSAMAKAYNEFNKQWQEREMTDRQFDLYIPEGQARDGRNRMKITCSHSGCTESIVFTKPGVISPVQAKNWFMDKGWHVAKTPAGDLCPDHYHHDRKPKRLEPVVEVTTPLPQSVPAKEIPVASIMSEPVEASTPPLPPLMDPIPKQDKRVIIAKLEEVYEDEDRGYRKGWNDERVAKDLGVEQDWVELVRAAIFGPAFSEADAEEQILKQQIEDHYRKIDAFAGSITEAHREFAKLMAELDGLMAKYRKLIDDK